MVPPRLLRQSRNCCPARLSEGAWPLEPEQGSPSISTAPTWREPLSLSTDRCSSLLRGTAYLTSHFLLSWSAHDENSDRLHRRRRNSRAPSREFARLQRCGGDGGCRPASRPLRGICGSRGRRAGL